MLILYLALIVTTCVFVVNCEPRYKDEERLQLDILSTYNKHIRPDINVTASVDVYASLYLDILYDLDFVNNILTARYWIQLKWTHEMLRWNPLNYKNISRTYLRKDMIWIPSITMCNTMKQSEDKDNPSEVSVYFNGSIEISLIKLLHTYCEINAYTFPFDEHTCNVSMCVSLQELHHAKRTKLTYKSRQAKHSKWDIKFSGGTNGTNYYHYSYVDATMYLRRKCNVGVIAMLIPTIMLTILTAFIFLLPPESGEKVTLATTIFLSNILYLAQIEKNPLINSKKPSLLVLYIMVLSLLCGIASIGSVIISKLYVNQSSDNNKVKASHQSNITSRVNQIADISIIPKEESNPVLKKDMSGKGFRKCIFHYSRLDDIFLKFTIANLTVFSIVFIYLLYMAEKVSSF
ncbi:acetylcholine receptor subunit beta-like 2 [Octopus bimaculoides]|nr:acetylcholine receptor subunit beta-like 2 [Octopus bimaculoides]|eukprot:XP_014786443.1 PREDICTED: acetylcholine receptor subunit beta-like 2 [Octopus bimaculoides]